MRNARAIIFFLFLLSLTYYSQAQKFTAVSISPDRLVSYGVKVTKENYKGKDAIALEQPADVDNQKTFAMLKDIDFHNGTIEVTLAGKPKENAIQAARGFVGIAFRIPADTTKFELFYVRPSNARAEDQVRRNHSTQYVSYPGFPWEKLRKETPEKYEAYADLIPGEWTKIRIIVKEETARLYVNGAEQPVLVVNDLKQGKDLRGSIGLWIGIGTIARFADLKVEKFD